MIILRSATQVYDIDVDEQTVLRQSLAGEDKIVSKFKYASIINLYLGDYIEYETRRYTINRLPEIIKTGNSEFTYSVEFEGEIYDLNDPMLRHEGVSDFTYYGTAAAQIALIVSNANRILTGWTAGTVFGTEKLLMTYSGDTCRTALTKLAAELKLEYSINSKAISLIVAVGSSTGLSFSYGQGNGLYSITRKNFDSGNVVTRLYGVGSERNIDYTYGQKRLKFTPGYIDNNISLYGIKEGEVIFEDIYPNRTGTVSGIDVDNINKFADATLFDINAQLIEGETAKVVFKTGNLAGYEFDITQYDDTAKSVLLIPFVEDDGYTLPNDTNLIQLGDTYTLVDIKMPPSYILAAENELLAATTAETLKLSIPRVLYGLNFDWRKLKTDLQTFNKGDTVTINDTDLGINSEIRITDIEFPIVSKYKIKANVSNYIPFSRAERQIIETAKNETQIEVVNVTNNELARRNTLRQTQLESLLFDPDGYSDGDYIKPLRIQTSIISIGVRSSNFMLNGAVFDVKAGGDANTFHSTAATLIHREIAIDEVGNIWNIAPPITISGLTPASSYYLYAKCSKTALNGEWVLTTAQQMADQTDYYYFWVGIMYPVLDGYRDFDFVNGKTQIVGDTITSGKLQDVTKQNYFDVENGKFNVGTDLAGLDWDVTTPDTLTIRGRIVQADAAELAAITAAAIDSTEKADAIKIGGVNLIIQKDLNHDYFLNNLGELVSNPAWFYTDYIDVRNYNQIIVGGYLNLASSPATCFYDINKVFVIGYSAQGGTNRALLSVPSGCAYMRFSGVESELPTLKLEGGNKATGWSPSPEDVAADAAIDATTKADAAALAVGPTPMYQGEYDGSKTYFGNTTRIDVVKSAGTYYRARTDVGSFSGHHPANPYESYWTLFGATFSSVATDLLFAELAYIENLGVKYLKTATSGQRIFINGDDGSLRFYDANNVEVMTLNNGKMTAAGAELSGNMKITSSDGNSIVNIGPSAFPFSGVGAGRFLGKSTVLGSAYGIYGEAQGGISAYGVYGKATGGTFANYGGYFVGDVKVSQNLEVVGNLEVDGTITGKIVQFGSSADAPNGSLYIGGDNKLYYKDPNGAIRLVAE